MEVPAQASTSTGHQTIIQTLQSLQSVSGESLNQLTGQESPLTPTPSSRQSSPRPSTVILINLRSRSPNPEQNEPLPIPDDNHHDPDHGPEASDGDADVPNLAHSLQLLARKIGSI